jgi:hypothetical protein
VGGIGGWFVAAVVIIARSSCSSLTEAVAAACFNVVCLSQLALFVLCIRVFLALNLCWGVVMGWGGLGWWGY